MATKKQRRSKEVAHKQKMQQKFTSAYVDSMINRTGRLVLLIMYIALADEFKFDTAKNSRLRKRMQRYLDYINNDLLSDSDMIKNLADRGIDVTKVGDDFV